MIKVFICEKLLSLINTLFNPHSSVIVDILRVYSQGPRKEFANLMLEEEKEVEALINAKYTYLSYIFLA